MGFMHGASTETLNLPIVNFGADGTCSHSTLLRKPIPMGASALAQAAQAAAAAERSAAKAASGVATLSVADDDGDDLDPNLYFERRLKTLDAAKAAGRCVYNGRHDKHLVGALFLDAPEVRVCVIWVDVYPCPAGLFGL